MNFKPSASINFSNFALPLVGLLFIVLAAMGAVFTAQDAQAATGADAGVETVAVQVSAPLMSLSVSGGGGNN